MKRLSVLTIVIFYCQVALSQLSIDKIQTDADVLSYVRKQEYSYATGRPVTLSTFNFEIFARSKIDTVKMFRGENARFIDSVTRKKWLKADFNADGKSDLVVYGNFNSPVLLAFISTRQDMDTCINLGYFINFHHFPHQIAVGYINGATCLLFGRIKSDDVMINRVKDEFFIDTLVYKFGGFVEYKPQEDEHYIAFDSIDYRGSSAWTGNEYWYIRLYKNGEVKYVRNRYINREDNPVSDDYYMVKDILKTQVEPREWHRLVKYMDVFQLKDNYLVPGLIDATTFVTTFYFPAGNTKIISDHAGEGMHILRLFYSKLYRLRESADWEMVNVSKELLKSPTDN